VLQVRAAEQLHRALAAQGLGSVTLEEPVSNISSEGTSKRGRRFAELSDQRRVDLAIWSRGELIYGIVEVKRAQNERDWEGDLIKICRLIDTYGRSRGNHLRYGVLGAFLATPTGAATRARARELAALSQRIVGGVGLVATVGVESEPVHWCENGRDNDWTSLAASVIVSTTRPRLA